MNPLQNVHLISDHFASSFQIIKLLDGKRSQTVGILISSLHLEMKDIQQGKCFLHLMYQICMDVFSQPLQRISYITECALNIVLFKISEESFFQYIPVYLKVSPKQSELNLGTTPSVLFQFTYHFQQCFLKTVSYSSPTVPSFFLSKSSTDKN